MGRIKQYSKKQKKKPSKKRVNPDLMDITTPVTTEDPSKHSSDALSVGKKKQLFKKEKAKHIKQKIQELKQQTKKLKKKKLDQKAEKKKISKEIKRLKKSLKESKEVSSDKDE
jgi:hypothetical protein